MQDRFGPLTALLHGVPGLGMVTQFCMIENYQNRKIQKQFIKLLKSTDEVMVEIRTRLAFSERTATATGGQRIERIQDIDIDLKCDLNLDIISCLMRLIMSLSFALVKTHDESRLRGVSQRLNMAKICMQ